MLCFRTLYVLGGGMCRPVLKVSREWTREGRVCCCYNNVYRGHAADMVFGHTR